MATSSSRSGFVLFFFFQAEGGIRDRDVTGVQTCALPISARDVIRRVFKKVDSSSRPNLQYECSLPYRIASKKQGFTGRGEVCSKCPAFRRDRDLKIGRASCRERV